MMRKMMLSIYILFCFLASTLSLKLIRSNTNYYPNRINNNHHHSFKLYSSSGAALELKNVFISIGNNDIISNINWAIMPKERWALVGPNGAGKSTLLKALTKTGGETLTIRDGIVETKPKARVGYLEQKGVSGSTKTVREEVSSRMDRLTDAQIALEHAEKLVSAGDTSDEALKLLEDASIEFEQAGGFTVEQKISNVLKGLGFLMEEYSKRCNEFSGGWQMRIALARLLLSEPDILILDEPTNHLDKGARNWLAGYLAAYDKTVLLVSHDVNLLKTAVNSIAEVRKGSVELYKSRTYDQWQIERDERVKIAKAEYEANIREIERLQSFVDRFGAKTMGASMAQSRLKTIEKIEAGMSSEAPTDADKPPPTLILPRPPRGSKVLLEMKNAVISWVPKSPTTDGTTTSTPAKMAPIISDCTVTIERGMRIAVRGPNGAGKTTFLSALSGRLPLTSGQRILGDGLELGTFTQDLAQDLDQTQTAVNVVANNVRHRDTTISDERVRSVLGALGLFQDKSTRLVGFLSGGEKARVALASFVLLPHNLLLLDEPSNHLDEPTLRVLTKALREFEGSCVVISHDRLFLEELDPTHVLTVRNGGVVMEERGLRESDWADDLFARTEFLLSSSGADVSTAQPTTTASSSSNSKGKSNNNNNNNKSTTTPPPTSVISSTSKSNNGANSKQLSKVEMNISRLEKEMLNIDTEMTQNAADSSKLMELQLKKDKVQIKMDKLYVEYEQLVA